MMISPTDPIFFLHHRNVDRLWWIWQNENPELALTYSRNSEEILNLFGYSQNMSVKDVLDTNSLEMCYTYTNSVQGSEIVEGGNEKRSENQCSINPYDRKNLRKIRYPKQLPLEFLLKMM